MADDLYGSAEHQLFRATVRKFVQDELVPRAREFDRQGRCDNAGVAMGISVHTDMATPSLHQFGSDELKRRWLVPSIKGEMVSATAVTEPDAGSDVASIKTRAVRDGDHWVINGS